MKKLILTLLLSSSIISLSYTGFSKEEEKEPPKLTKAELKDIFEKNVTKIPNGDVVVTGINKPKGNSVYLNGLMTYFIYYANPNLDFEKFDKHLKNSLGKKADTYKIGDLMDGISRYLGTQNLKFRKFSFSFNNAANSLDDGLLIFAYIKQTKDDATKKALVARTKERTAAKTIDDWKKELRKQEIKKFNIDNNNTLDGAIVCGFNKDTKEILILADGGYVWITEKEFKLLDVSTYSLSL